MSGPIGPIVDMNNLPETPSLSLQSAADQYGVCVRTIRRRIASGEPPAFRIGRAIRVRPSDVASLARPIGGAA